LRAEVRRRPSFLIAYYLQFASRNKPLYNGRCENGCTHPSTLPSPYAKPQTRHKQRAPRSQQNGVQSGRRFSRKVVLRDRSLVNTWYAREKWTCSSARSSARACVGFRSVMHVIVCCAAAEAVVVAHRQLVPRSIFEHAAPSSCRTARSCIVRGPTLPSLSLFFANVPIP
jgi:hypothetical protein